MEEFPLHNAGILYGLALFIFILFFIAVTLQEILSLIHVQHVRSTYCILIESRLEE